MMKKRGSAMEEELEWLIGALLAQMPQYRAQAEAFGPENRFRLFRALVNLRPPQPADQVFLSRQDAYLRHLTAQKGITEGEGLSFNEAGLALWRGDITTLRCDAIVNAANSALLGCFCPNHGCIDNAIHTFSGVQLRLACAELMARQGHEEPAGQAKLTPAFGLPCRYVLHTVGPIVGERVTERDQALLASCYRACLALAEQSNCASIAFCCISTGEFHFPSRLAAETALRTVREYKAETGSRLKVIFNVFKQADEEIYRALPGMR